VNSAGWDGLYVEHADRSGVLICAADSDGVRVTSAGAPSATNPSSENNGLEVEGAEGYGLFIGSADLDGVHVAGAGGYAGYFGGDVHVAGTLSKGAGSFQIDHPLDPQNKYLSHSFVESPDMMNIYNGNVVLDERGEAWVELPDWFEALNGGQEHRSEFRYQLTCIGGFAPVYIAQEIEDNRFQIAGGAPGLKVSWQVTGVRHDPYAEAHRIPVEEDKPPDERGAYLHPEVYDQP